MPSEPVSPGAVPGGDPPPPLLPAEPPALPGVAPFLAGRLHPLTLALALVTAFRNFLIPAVIVLFTGSERTLGLMLLGLLGINLTSTLFRYFTFRYRIEHDELVTREGLIERRERNIPLNRVQDVRLEAGLFHRLLGVVDVHVETAGGQGAEASLSVLTREQAENLRRAVFAAAGSAPDRVAGQAGGAVEPEVLRRLTVRELVLEGLTSNRAASALILLAAGWQFLDDLLPERLQLQLASTFSRGVESWFLQGGQTNWTALGVGTVVVFAVSALFSVAGSLVLFHGFTLARRGEDLQRNYGLLTRRASSLPRRRIQLVRLEESWLRRLCGWATVRADTAGSQPTEGREEHSGRDLLLPLVRRAELERLFPAFFPDWDGGPSEWRRVARCAIRRGFFKGALVCLAFMLASILLHRAWWSAGPLLFLPLVYAVNAASYRHLGFHVGPAFFRTRRGWINRTTHLVPVRNVQVVVVRETPFDRRHGVGTLQVDTAGQKATASGPEVRNVPRLEAFAAARMLAHQASQIRYRW